MPNINLYLDREINQKIADIAAIKNISKADVIVDILKESVNKIHIENYTDEDGFSKKMF